MASMEPLLKDNDIITKSAVAKIKEAKLKMQKRKELEETFSSSLNGLNENRLPGTSNTSAFLITNSKSVVNNTVTISYAGDNVCNKTLPIEEAPKSSSDHLHSVSNDVDLLLHFADKRDNVLPAIKDNLLSLQNAKPDAFQLQAEAYNDQVKASISKSAGAKEIYFRFRVQESLHKVIRYKTVVFQCHICKGIYKQKFSLKRHFLRNHINPKYISAADLSNCKIPIRNQEIIKKFVEESKTPSGRKKFNLKHAIFFVPDGKTRIPGLFKCHQCPGILFDIEQELEEHYSSHLILHRDDIFPCNLCSSVFQRKQALSKHMVLHSEKKVIFHCKKCPQKFEKITDYTCHLQSHGSGKRCKYCEKEFSTPANRKRHENIHERGRVFSCKFCKAKFSRSKELEKHTKKLHFNLTMICPHCPLQANPVIFTSQYLLEAHMTLKHRDIPGKKIVTSNKTTAIYKTHNQKSSKECFCCYCKKKFSTVKAMVSHKNIVHKHEIALHKPKKSGQKELTKEKPQGDSEVNQKLKNVFSNEKSLGEKNVASKGDDHARKTGILGKKRTTYERKAKSSSQYKLSKDKSYRKKDEAEKFFYCNVSSNVADNLLNHVDGGPSQINLKKSNFEDQNESLDYRSSTNEIPWSAHSFPNYFELDNAVSKRAEKSQLFPEEQCLYATGLERNEVLVENILNLSSDNSSGAEVQHNNQDNLLILEEKETLINHEICATYVCDVCKGTFSSYSAFEEHCFNNHPNVQVSYVEIEGTSKSPPKIPGELRRLPYTQPNGMLASREVPMLTQEKFDIKCTKCETKFNNKNDLYTHIFRCVAKTKDICFRKNPHQKNRKGLTMKNQTDLVIKPIKSSGWFIQNKRIFKSGCFRRNKFQRGKYYFSPQANKRGRRKLPLPSKLRPNPCPHCESVFISSAKLPEHVEICTYRFKSEDYKLKKKNQLKKQRNDRSHELSPIPISEKGGIGDTMKNSDISDQDTSLLNCSYNLVLSNESQVASADSDMTFSAADLSLITPFKSVSEVSYARGNCSVSSCGKNFAVERNNLKTSELSDFDMLRNLVKEVEPMLPKDLQVDDVSESCFKRKEVISNNSLDKSMVRSSVDNCLADNLGKNENIAQQITAETKEIPPGLVSINLPKIKEVVKEMQLAASSLPNLKKSNTPLTFLSSEVNQNVELSSQNNSSVQTAPNSQPEKEYVAANDSQQSEKARQRKKRKPVKIMQKMTNETVNSQKIGIPPFSNKTIGGYLPSLNLEKNSFKPIENSGGRISSMNTDVEITNSTDSVTEKDIINFSNSDKKCCIDVLESSITSSKDIQINTDNQELSTTAFLSEDKTGVSGDRDSPSLEVLVSSVTQNIENFDKPSLLDDEKFVLQSPDLINPTTAKSTEMNISPNNGLNFKIIIPTSESPSKSKVSDKDSLIDLATKISADNSINEIALHTSTNNVKTSVINKMKSILNVAENAIKTSKPKELVNSRVENVSSSDKNTSVNDNIYALIPHSQNKSPTSSTTVNIEVFSPESQQSLSSDETGRKLHKKNSELSGKSASRQKDKKGDDAYKEDSDKKGKDDSIKPVQGEFAISNEVDTMTLISGQKSKQLKDKVRSKMTEVVETTPNETDRTELQKKEGPKVPLNKCDSKNNKNASPKLPAENHQPKFILETNSLLSNKNENKIEGGISTSENCAKLRFLRMKRPAPDEFSDQTANGSTKLIRNLSETDISHNQISGKKKMLNNSESVAVNISEAAVVAVNNLGGAGAQASIEIAKDFNCKDNCSKSLEEFPIAGSDRDVVVKKEKLDSEIVTHRNCPYCYLDFAYLSNFRRHLKICPSRPEDAASEAPIASTSSQFQHLPKKNEVEESMLNLLRHQSRQNELIKDTQKNEDSKTKNSFQKFSCPVCHKIYLSYFSFMQHTVKAHKMTNQETKTADPYAPSTSQGVTVMPLEESTSESNMSLPEVSDTDISSELSTNIKNSTKVDQSSVIERSQIDAIEKERNTSVCVNHDEIKSNNKEIESGSTQNVAMCVENLNSRDGYTSVTKTIVSSSDERKVSESQTGRELSDTSLSILPAFGKGRGRKKKSILENVAENRRELKTEVQSAKTEDISSVNDSRDDTNSKKEPVTNNPLLKEVSKALLSDLQSSPKNTLVNKLRSTLSKSMQSGDKLKSASSKFGKKSEIVKSNITSDVKHLENGPFSFKSLIKKNPIETLKITGKTDVLNGSQPLHIPRRGRKKSVVAQAPIEAIDSSIEAKNIEQNSRLQDTSKSNKLKALRKQSLPGPGSPTISDEKGISIKKSIANTFQSSKLAKSVKSTKISLQEVDTDTFSSQKSNTVSRKAKGPRGIKANCDNEPTPSTSYGPSRGRKSKPINISLDLSSELEDVEDIQQRNPKLKKRPNNKVCPICKQKFPTLLQRNRHLQLVHGRKRSRNDGSISPTLVSMKKETVNKLIDSSVKKEIVNKISDSSLKKETVNKVSDSLAIVPHRSAYQRQCSKPLPPMKRKYQKVGVKNIQPVKKTKF